MHIIIPNGFDPVWNYVHSACERVSALVIFQQAENMAGGKQSV